MESTPHLGLKKLLEDGADPVTAYREAINANSTVLDDALVLQPVASAVSVAAVAGEIVKATAAITVTTPAAAAGASFGVLANGKEVIIEAASGRIFGLPNDFAGQEKIIITQYQAVILVSDGTEWYIVAGETSALADHEGYSFTGTKAEAEAGLEISHARPASIVINLISESATAMKAEIKNSLGGAAKINVPAGTGLTEIPVPYYLPPGAKWQLAPGSSGLKEIVAAGFTS